MKEIRIIHADDHDIVHRATQIALQSEPNFIVVGHVYTYEQLLELLPEIPVDVLLLDGAMPGGTPDEFLPTIKTCYPSLKVILLWIAAGEESLTEWGHFLDGQIPLMSEPSEYIKAIKAVMLGERYFVLPVYKRHKENL
jgi:DNA-binding NarL/FixJ family response regulator